MGLKVDAFYLVKRARIRGSSKGRAAPFSFAQAGAKSMVNEGFCPRTAMLGEFH